MSTSSPPPKKDEKDTNSKQEIKPTSLEDDDKPSVWGVVSFAIIFAIFALSIVATIARDFIPGGVSTPVS